VKKLVVLLVLFVFMAGLILIANDGAFAWLGKKDKKDKEEAVEETKPEEPKLVHKFNNDEELAEFEQLYIAKQATLGRIGVLQAYFAMEQNNLTQVDAQLEEKYGFRMEPSKMYDLNRETREIKEIGVVPAAVPAVQ